MWLLAEIQQLRIPLQTLARGFSPRLRFVQVASALQNLRQSASFQFSLHNKFFVFPLSSSHFIVLVHFRCYDCACPDSMRLANEFDLTALASVSRHFCHRVVHVSASYKMNHKGLPIAKVDQDERWQSVTG